MQEFPRRTGQVAPLSPTPLSAADALFLDFDGSLVELAARPDRVAVDPQLPALLGAVARRLGGALAIVSGRPLADLDRFLAPLRLPAAGAHGTELRERDGGVPRRLHAPGAAELARALRARFIEDPRVLIEDKGAVVALHFRLAPERARECTAALHELLGRQPQFQAVPGNKVVEARPRGWDKGRAVRELLRVAPFTGRRPIAVGDDASDEDAFAAARELGGYGIKVGGGPTRARLCVTGVAAVHAWLRESLGREEAA